MDSNSEKTFGTININFSANKLLTAALVTTFVYLVLEKRKNKKLTCENYHLKQTEREKTCNV